MSNGPESLDSDLLRSFLAVVDTGSISGGSERVFRSQSAVSLRIKRLEGIVGTSLFTRHGRGIALTPDGEDLLPVARRVVALLDRSLAHFRTDSCAGTLRVGIPDEYGQSILPRIVAAFARDNPRVELSVTCALSARFPRSLQSGDLDMAVHDVPTAGAGQEVVARQRTVWATSRHHLVHELTPVPVALFDRECWWRDQAMDMLNRAGRPFRIAYTSESLTGVLAAIDSGIAVGLVGAESVRDGRRILTEAEGYPSMPGSVLVLECRAGVDPALAKAMGHAIRSAFRGRADEAARTAPPPP